MLLVFETWPWLFLLTALLFGLLVGSFLNVVIYRIPVMMERAWDAQFKEWQAEREATSPTSEPVAAVAIGETGAESIPNGPLPADDDASNLADISTEPNASVPGTDADADQDNETDDALPVFNLAQPASTCPHCDHKIRAIENIPVLSYVFLRGKCANCKTPISWRYPFVEALTGLLTLLVALRFGPGVEAVAGIVLTWFLIALSGIDIDHQLLPDNMTLPLLWLGLTLSLFTPANVDVLFVSPQSAIVGGLIGYLSLWSVFHAFRLITGKHGMGHGDFKLLAALGAWLGWQALPLIIVLSAVLGSVYGVLMIAFGRQTQGATMPFGPWLAVAGWLFLMFGETLNAWYFGIMGLS